jgi:hypothetical protein
MIMTVPPETGTFCTAYCLSGNTRVCLLLLLLRLGGFDVPRTQHIWPLMSCCMSAERLQLVTAPGGDAIQ